MTMNGNPFASLLDPAGILSACARSGALEALPVSAKRCADRTRPGVAAELAEHDAAVEELDRKLLATSRAAPVKSRKIA